jgi:membrane protein implicated in regulation of membrane protease activity
MSQAAAAAKTVIDPKQESLDALVAWSKWLMGVKVVSIAGCITMLKLGMNDEQKQRIKWAVLAFLISLAFAALLGMFAAWQKATAAKHKRVWLAWILALAEVVALTIGACFLYAWVDNVKPQQPPDDAALNARAAKDALKAAETLREIYNGAMQLGERKDLIIPMRRSIESNQDDQSN